MDFDGSLRWIITPEKGKVYFLSPVTAETKVKKDYSKIPRMPQSARNIQFNARGDFCYIARHNNKEQFFVNGRIKSPEGHQGLCPCIIDKRGRAIMQLRINAKEVLMLENQIVSHDKAEQIGAWQVNPKGEVVLAQKVDGKWGVYHNGEKISPECNMVWGWQITQDNKFIVPVEYKRGNNLVLLQDNEIVYGGKGNLLTWHWESKNLWVLAIEDANYRFYKNSVLAEQFPLSRGTLENWTIKNNKINAEFTNRVCTETPRTCHPEKEYVATNEWWFQNSANKKTIH